MLTKEGLQAYNTNDLVVLGKNGDTVVTTKWSQEHPNHLLISGSTGSGYTNMLRGLMHQLTNLGDNPYSKVILATQNAKEYSKIIDDKYTVVTGADELYSRVKLLNNNIKINMKQGLDTKKATPLLFVIDDFESNLKDFKFNDKLQKELAELVVMAREFNITVIIKSVHPNVTALGAYFDGLFSQAVGYNSPKRLRGIDKEVYKDFKQEHLDTGGGVFYWMLPYNQLNIAKFENTNYTKVTSIYLDWV